MRMCALRRGSYLLSDPHHESLLLGRQLCPPNDKGAAVSSKAMAAAIAQRAFAHRGNRGIFVLLSVNSAIAVQLSPPTLAATAFLCSAAESCRFQNGIFL